MITTTEAHTMHRTKRAIETATPTEGTANAPKILGKVPVRWTLDPANGHVTSNGEYAGRVIEALPGKLYFFEAPEDTARHVYWGSFETAARAAEQGAVRAELGR